MGWKIFVVSFLSAAAALAQPRAIDSANSTLTIHVYKSGLLSALGHNHEIAAPVAAGTVDAAARKVELRVAARALQVRDTGISESDRAKIQTTMLGPDVLDSARSPEIAFQSASAESAAAGSWKVQGTLSLHGQTRPVTIDVRETGGHYEGVVRLKQTDFGIKPVKAGGGAVKVKDEIQIDFKIQLVQN